MFTGIVQNVGRVAALEAGDAATRLTLEPGGDLAAETRPPREGDSLSVAGVCLTVAALDPGGRLSFDVVPETLRCTKLGDLRPGDEVNLEPAVAPHQPMGGHFMQGHVDTMSEVIELRHADEEVRLAVGLDASLRELVTPKGSIAIDGVSLTIAAVSHDRFEIALIPSTLEWTTLGQLQAGDRVNVESDIIARTVVQWLERHASASASAARSESVTRELLDDAGFDRMG